MTKTELIAAIEGEWEALQAAIGGLDEQQMTGLPVFADWTVKDILAHLAVWESRLVTDLFKIERGVSPDWVEVEADVDKLNAQFYREQKHRPLERVLDDLHSVHLALLNRLEGLSDAALSDPGKHRFTGGKPLSAVVAADSAEHYQEHTPQIVEWRKARGF